MTKSNSAQKDRKPAAAAGRPAVYVRTVNYSNQDVRLSANARRRKLAQRKRSAALAADKLTAGRRIRHGQREASLRARSRDS